MRRHIGGHADGDTACAIDEQIGEACGQHRRLTPRTVIIVREVDSVLVEIVQQHVGDACQARLGVTHGRRRIGIHRSEIALTIDQRHAKRPVLRHSRECIVDRGIAVRMVVAHRVADDLGALAIGPPGDEAAFLAGEQDTPVYRLQSVAHVGQGTADDHAHRVIEIACLHFLDDVDTAVITRRCGRNYGLNVVAQGGPDPLVAWRARPRFSIKSLSLDHGAAIGHR